jgi:hypothetical protein
MVKIFSFSTSNKDFDRPRDIIFLPPHGIKKGSVEEWYLPAKKLQARNQ